MIANHTAGGARWAARLILTLSVLGAAACDDGEQPVAADVGAGGVGAGGAGGLPPCTEGETICEGFDELICRDGLYERTNSGNCRAEVCDGDNCQEACITAARNKSYLGCEYWAVDLDNAIEVVRPVGDRDCPAETVVRDDLDVCVQNNNLAWLCEPDGTCENGLPCMRTPVCVYDAQRSPFAIVVSNPSTEQQVTVGLQGPGGESHFEQVAPGAVAKIYPSQLGFADWSVNHTSQGARAYKLTATEPIVAYQFNPLDNVGVFSNDGSLLIPAHAFDSIYYAMTQPSLDRSPIHDYSGYITVVASAEGATEIAVQPTAAVRAGPELPSFPAGASHAFTLQQGEVLNLAAVGEGDLTGTRVESPAGTPFGVFVGHEATGITDLAPQPCCADHIEEQLFPASTWGLRFAIARTEPRTEGRRGEPVADMLRIMALEDDTEIRLDPPARDRQMRERPVCRIGQGEVCDDFFIDRDTLVIASQPILVGQFLLSAGGVGADAGNPMGDPAMAFAPPFEQFRTDYTFLAPDEYAEQYISVVSRDGAPVTLDGRRIDDALTLFADVFVGGRIPIAAGQHRLECPSGCGLLVYGYSPAVSYLFAGGLDLQRITVP